MVDERDRLRRLRALEAEQAATAPSTKVDPYYVRDPKTGLSQAQVEAQQGLQAAQKARTDLGLAGVLTTPAGSAGRIDAPPTTGLKAGYEWYQFVLPGGGTEWRQRPTRDTLVKSYTTLFSGGPTGPGGDGGPTGPTGETYTAPDGRIFTDFDEYNAYINKIQAEEKRRTGQSAWNLLKGYLDTYGIGMLATDVQKYIEEGMSYDELLLKLRTESTAYKRRFAANERRIAKGLRALSEAEYINLEDDYQNIMRRYGMPESYYTETVDPTTGIRVQQGFEKFIEGDVSPVELEDRIQTAYSRVINAAPEVMNSLRQFYGDTITNGDILAYALDTKNAIENIKRKVGAAEIGAEAMQAGLTTSMARAEELQRFGVTQAQAEQGFQAIADILPSAQRLSQFYAKQGLGEYTQTTAEQEAFGIPGSAEAGRKRRKLTELEQASFAGQAGTAGGALARERAGSF